MNRGWQCDEPSANRRAEPRPELSRAGSTRVRRTFSGHFAEAAGRSLPGPREAAVRASHTTQDVNDTRDGSRRGAAAASTTMGLSQMT